MGMSKSGKKTKLLNKETRKNFILKEVSAQRGEDLSYIKDCI